MAELTTCPIPFGCKNNSQHLEESKQQKQWSNKNKYWMQIWESDRTELSGQLSFDTSALAWVRESCTVYVMLKFCIATACTHLTHCHFKENPTTSLIFQVQLMLFRISTRYIRLGWCSQNIWLMLPSNRYLILTFF